jgi:drug/metabolite transporter (DMT)-like permease
MAPAVSKRLRAIIIMEEVEMRPYVQPMTINSLYNEFPPMPWRIFAFILGLAGVCCIVFLLGSLAATYNQGVSFCLLALMLAGVDVYYIAQFTRAWLARTPIQRIQALKAIRLNEE